MGDIRSAELNLTGIMTFSTEDGTVLYGLTFEQVQSISSQSVKFGSMEERARIVTWLRSKTEWCDGETHNRIAASIERGEHEER